MSIKIEHLRKRFGTFTAVDDVTLDIREGELLALLGPSGSGKTTLLRGIAGLGQADGGRVLFDGEDATSLSVQARRAGFVFQHYALFRHLTVEENIAFGLRVRRGKQRVADAANRARVAELLSLVQENCFYYLEAPIERVTGWDTPYPHAQEWAYFPGPDRVGAALRRTMEA